MSLVVEIGGVVDSNVVFFGCFFEQGHETILKHALNANCKKQHVSLLDMYLYESKNEKSTKKIKITLSANYTLNKTFTHYIKTNRQCTKMEYVYKNNKYKYDKDSKNNILYKMRIVDEEEINVDDNWVLKKYMKILHPSLIHSEFIPSFNLQPNIALHLNYVGPYFRNKTFYDENEMILKLSC